MSFRIGVDGLIGLFFCDCYCFEKEFIDKVHNNCINSIKRCSPQFEKKSIIMINLLKSGKFEFKSTYDSETYDLILSIIYFVSCYACHIIDKCDMCNKVLEACENAISNNEIDENTYLIICNDLKKYHSVIELFKKYDILKYAGDTKQTGQIYNYHLVCKYSNGENDWYIGFDKIEK